MRFVTVSALLLATGLTLSAAPPALVFTPLAPFFVAVALSAWAGGTRPALIALLVSLLPIHFVVFVSRPVASAPPELAAYVVFVLVSVLLIAVTESRDRAIKHAQRERARAEALTDATRGLGGVNPDLGATLDAVVHTAAREVGDLAVLRLLSRDGVWLEAVAWKHPDPARNQSVHDIGAG